MRSTSFPCLICGRELLRASNEFEPQPSDGVMCSTEGNYGSTVYDPVLTGAFIAFNICDACFVQAGEQGRLFESRHYRPIKVDGWGIIGAERVERPYVPWHEGMPGDGDYRAIDLDDPMWDDPPERFHFKVPLASLRESEDP